jgi:hypothetical protein
VDDYFNANQMSIRNKTAFHSAELNLVRRVKDTNLSLLGGFRYIGFDETFNLQTTPDLRTPTAFSNYIVDARNDLFGGQLGMKLDRSLTERLGMQFTGKAGVYGNTARQHTWLNNDGSVVRNDTMQKNKTAFVGELNLGGYFRITESLSFVGGYNLMWVGDTARAADQLDFTYLANSSRLVTTDTLFMHGANVGVEWCF